MSVSLPHLQFEEECWEKNFLPIGVDEVGRGAFAGPLVAAGVIFEPCGHAEKMHLQSLGINDSKKLSAKAREELSPIIEKLAHTISIEAISVPVINRVGIGKATTIAVRKIVGNIRKKLGQENRKLFLLNDAFYHKYIRGIRLTNQKAIIHGDAVSLSIAAASIVAKVYRDNLMKKLAKEFPKYGFEHHVGYGTEKHRKAIMEFGKTHIHRTAFLNKLLSSSF